MVQQVEINRKEESKAARLKRLTGKNSAQHAFNSLLWRLIADAGGVISIKGSELRKIPNKLLLKADWDEKTQSLIITSVVNQNKVLVPYSANGIILT